MIVLKCVGYIDYCKVDIAGQDVMKVMTFQSVRFSDSTSHLYSVDGMT